MKRILKKKDHVFPNVKYESMSIPLDFCYK